MIILCRMELSANNLSSDYIKFEKHPGNWKAASSIDNLVAMVTPQMK
ncbi:MAG: hypothetical protein RI572_09610 [Salegentibacter sp.]|nr:MULTISPECIES: hypothetical protein [Salegentibacter]MDR9457655.1 hypothetical protein [Salegentibacter sp.]